MAATFQKVFALPPPTKGGASRACAARALGAVLHGQGNLKGQLEAQFQRTPSLSPVDRRFATQLAFGGARVSLRLLPLIDSALKHPLKDRDQDLRALMVGALYQMHWLGAAPPLCVNGAVEATRALKKPWASKLVNAVLRRFPAEVLSATLADQSSKVQSGLPPWWYEALAHAYPNQLAEVIAAGNSEPPLTLRVDGDRNAVAAKMESLGFEPRLGTLSAKALYLDKAPPLQEIPGFLEGQLTVQDEGAQVTTELLELTPGLAVLDACAAPGGKASALLAACPGVQLTALDPSSKRVERLLDTLKRTGRKGFTVHCADALEPGPWQRAQGFDRILVDAPCSGTGILRRQPDIRLLRQPGELAKLSALQGALLRALFPQLKAGGRLVYCTCSVLPDEGEALVAKFVAETPEARALSLPESFGQAAGPGRQGLPTRQGPDGFFYAVLEKVPKP